MVSMLEGITSSLPSPKNVIYLCQEYMTQLFMRMIRNEWWKRSIDVTRLGNYYIVRKQDRHKFNLPIIFVTLVTVAVSAATTSLGAQFMEAEP